MPRKQRLEPAEDQWRRLFAAARAFCDLAPWKRWNDAIHFAVDVPGAREPMYLSILGAGGEEFGLLAHRGAAGLLGYTLTVDDAADRDELLLMQDCLALTMVDRDDVDAADRAVYASLGLRFRGRGAWPLFRSCRPSLVMAHVTPDEADHLATCLEQACILAAETSPESTAALADDQVLVRRGAADGAWRTEVGQLPTHIPIPAAFDRDRLALASAACQQGDDWEARLVVVAPIDEGGGSAPYWGRMLLCVERKSGIVLSVDVMERDATVQEALLGVVEATGVHPARLYLTSPLLARQLSLLAEALGIRVEGVKRLPKLERVQASLMGFVR